MNSYICKLKEDKFHHASEKTLHIDQKIIILVELLENNTPVRQIAEKSNVHVNDIYNL